MLAAEAIKGRDLRLKVRRIRSGASRDRHEDVVWLDCMAPHRHLDVDGTVASARTNTNVPRIGARLALPGSFAVGSGTHDMDLRTLLCLARLRFKRSIATILSLWRMGADWRLWRLGLLIA
jgi:hypothetical protein